MSEQTSGAVEFIARIDEIITQGRPSDQLWNHCVAGRNAAMTELAALRECAAAIRGLLSDPYLRDPINNDRMAGARAALLKLEAAQGGKGL